MTFPVRSTSQCDERAHCGKAEIRERAAAREIAVPRSAANFVIQGLIYSGADPRNGKRSAREFGEQWCDAVLHLCERADLEIDAEDKAEIQAWLLGGLPCL